MNETGANSETGKQSKLSIQKLADDQTNSNSIKSISEIVSVVKDTILTLAVIIAGGWALYRYELTESISAKVRYELELARAKQQIQLSTSLQESVKKIGDKYMIYGKINLKNIGSKDIVGDIEKSAPVSLFKIDINKNPVDTDDEAKIVGYIFDEDGKYQDAISIDVGSELSLPFAIIADQKGMYLLNIAIPVPQGALSGEERLKGQNWTWSEQKIIELE